MLVRYLVEQSFRTSTVREIVENLRKTYGQWPLATAPLKHDGRLAVIQEGNEVFIDAADGGDQRVIAKTLIELRAVRSALENGGWVSYRHPRKHIEVDPDRLSGQPVIKNRRVPTSALRNLRRARTAWSSCGMSMS